MLTKKIEAKVTAPKDQDDIFIELSNPAQVSEAQAHLKDMHATTLQIISTAGAVIEVRYFDAVVQQYKEQIIGQAIEVIRNRVDQFGVAEPVIAAQGSDRILVQLPGVKDPGQAKELINKTARLDFRLVDSTLKPEDLNAMIADTEKTGNFALGKDKLSYAAYVKKINEALKVSFRLTP